MLWFVLTGHLSTMIGMALTDSLDGVTTAVVTALAAGSVISVGVSEMLLPAFKDGQGLGWKLLAAWSRILVMSLLSMTKTGTADSRTHSACARAMRVQLVKVCL